ncbi:hypothetical protein V6N11_051940 [Hibiscus sabdariffa]|uniref:Uncharacterized protein n=1 Tax=Hibiscus sabdariffa TaxID=183260 RepID=A0ABR2U8H8_9ROSI
MVSNQQPSSSTIYQKICNGRDCGNFCTSRLVSTTNLEGRQIKVQGFCSSENSSSENLPLAIENSGRIKKTRDDNLGSREIINSDIPEGAKVTAGEKPNSQLGEEITSRKDNKMSWADIVAKHGPIPEQVNEGPLFPNIRECSEQVNLAGDPITNSNQEEGWTHPK